MSHEKPGNWENELNKAKETLGGPEDFSFGKVEVHNAPREGRLRGAMEVALLRTEQLLAEEEKKAPHVDAGGAKKSSFKPLIKDHVEDRGPSLAELYGKEGREENGDLMASLKVSAEYLRGWILKAKERVSGLSEEEIDQLLTIEFNEELWENPPMAEKRFSPEEELKRIKKLPKEERKEAVIYFKYNLEKQRKALASCRTFIERAIEFNNDVPKETLLRIAGRFSANYGFTGEQENIIEDIIRGYYGARRDALEMKEAMTDQGVAEMLVGVPVTEEDGVEVSVGPMNLEIGVREVAMQRFWKRSGGAIRNTPYGYANRATFGGRTVNYSVIAREEGPLGERDKFAATRKHEYEHHKNSLFRAVFGQPEIVRESNLLFEEYKEETDPQLKRALLDDLLRFERDVALERARDELTAIYAEGGVKPDDFSRFAPSIFSDKKGNYDYLKEIREHKLPKPDPYYEVAVKNILEGEYMDAIRRAIEAIAELTKKEKCSPGEAIALLTDKPLMEWPKTVRRILDRIMVD